MEVIWYYFPKAISEVVGRSQPDSRPDLFSYVVIPLSNYLIEFSLPLRTNPSRPLHSSHLRCKILL
jgi:hypothetical protein